MQREAEVSPRQCTLPAWVWLCCLFDLLAAVILAPGVLGADAEGSATLVLSWSALAERWCLSHVSALISVKLLLRRSCKTCGEPTGCVS